MKLDKKSLIQVVILVVLIVGGAGVYFMQQDGGLDFLTSMFESEPTTIRAPTPVAKKPVPKPDAAPAPAQTPAPPPAAAPAPEGPMAKPAAPAIPDAPAQGQMQGSPFIVDSSHLEGGVLVLRHGQGTDAREIRVTLPDTTWEVPSGRNFRVTESDVSAPAVEVATPAAAKSATRTVIGKYAMVLEFGKEADKKLPGKIQLNLPDDTKVAGTFTAELRGFRIVEGKPDLSADSVETLQFLALRELLKDDPSKALEVVAFRNGRYTPTGTGTLEVEYRIAQGAPKVQRFQFVKAGGAWRVAQAAKSNTKPK